MSFFITNALAAEPITTPPGIEGMVLPIAILWFIYYLVQRSKSKLLKVEANTLGPIIPINDIYIFRDGKTTSANIQKLFVTHGPYIIEGNRLDLLTKAQIVVDSSTSSISQVGTSSSTANTGSMLGRAVVGGVLTGGAGAVIGGLSGKRDSTINTVSSESKSTELTTELTFEDGSNLYVLIKSMESFHWLLGFASQRAWSEGEIEAFRNQALNCKYEDQVLAANKKAISLIAIPKFGSKDVINKAKTKVREETFAILQSIPDVSRALEYDEFVTIYENALSKSKIINGSKVFEQSEKFSIYTLFNWLLGGFLILTSIGDLLKQDLNGFLIAFTASMFFLPPVRDFVYSKTKIKVPLIMKLMALLLIGSVIIPVIQDKNYTPSVKVNEAAKAPEAPTVESPPTPSLIADTLGSQWGYSQNEDKMNGGNTYHAVVLSSNTVDLKFPYNGSQNAKLHLRIATKSGKNLMFSLEKGQILCNSYDGCSVLVRFDNEKATNYSATAAADNSTEIIFIDNYSKFVEKMIKAKRVLISADIYQQGAPVFEFDVSGFDKEKYKPKK